MGEDLAEGRQVHLDGIGYFHPVLTSTEPVTAATNILIIQIVAINFIIWVVFVLIITSLIEVVLPLLSLPGHYLIPVSYTHLGHSC